MDIRRWTIAEAAKEFDRIERYFRLEGWILAMYGSTAHGAQGRDLDLLAVPWRTCATNPCAVVALVFPGLVPRSEPGIMSTHNFAFQYRERIYDIQFRANSPVDPWCEVI